MQPIQAALRRTDSKFLLLTAVFLIGMAHLLFLPPWEGYDELAHFSYVQEIADEGHGPRPGIDRLSGDLEQYSGPFPYGQTSIFPGHQNYREFSGDIERTLAAGPTSFSGLGSPNWEAQHPPLFYWVLVPAYEATKSLGWKPVLLAMRATSWILAFIGLVILAVWTPLAIPSFRINVGMAALVWPFIVPEFFPEMARLGNDSLCLLIASALWILCIRTRGNSGWQQTLLVGILLGLGLLTKAFFLPLGAGILLFIFFKRREAGLSSAALHVLGLALIAGVIGFWWYFSALEVTGVFGGGNEFAQAKKVGIVAGLAQNFHPAAFAKGIFGIASTFTWAGTWFFAVYHAWVLTPLLLLPGIPLVRWLTARETRTLDGTAPLFLLVPMLAGLVYHELAWIATGHGGPGTPGWYLNILVGPLSYAWARGWTDSRPMKALFALTVCFTAILWACQLSVFSGSTVPDMTGHLPLTTGWWRIDIGSLSRLAYPGAACLLLSIGIAAGLCSYWQSQLKSRSDAVPLSA